MADILITGATVITMDPERRLIEDGAVAIVGDRITAVGSRAEIEAAHSAPTVIDASRMVCLPGLVDVHGHAGHALVKTMDHDSFTLAGGRPSSLSTPRVSTRNSGTPRPLWPRWKG